MIKKTKRMGRNNRGMAMIFALFLLVVLMPLTLIFLRWANSHRQATMQGRLQVKEYYAGTAAGQAAIYGLKSAGPAWWEIDKTSVDTLHTGDGTDTTVRITAFER